MGVPSPAAMEVPPDKFLSNLVSVIPTIADAKFVVIDLEMSGINPPSIPKISKPTMEEIYQRAREATKTFCMLQFGLTCIMKDETKGNANGISMLSHNYHISPMFNDRWDKHARSLAQVVDRTLTISYDTLIFLKKNCVRIEDVYMNGVTYLSRAEEAAATPRFLPSPKTANERRDGVDLENADEETQAFFKFVRSTIKTWADNPDNTRGSFLNISNPHGETLNRFQQRLIYQILDDDFPGKYNAFCRGNEFMQICHKDDKEESEHQSKTVKKREAALCEQRGLRYIIEALVGGDFASGIEVARQAKYPGSDEHIDAIKSAEQKLKQSRPVLVGHNMFLDLCFMYATFFGPLPETLDAFKEEIHKHFPRIIDTKYIVTLGEHDMMPAMNLEDLYKRAESDGVNGVFSPFNPNGMKSHTKNHHAGHDSYMTAVVFCKEMKERLHGGSPGKGETSTKFTPEDDKELTKKLMQWDSDACVRLSNKIRIGNSGIMDLDKSRARNTLTEYFQRRAVTNSLK